MTQSLEIDLTPENNERLANLCGPFNKHLTIIENSLGVEISNRNYHFQLIGEIKNIHNAVTVLEKIIRRS